MVSVFSMIRMFSMLCPPRFVPPVLVLVVAEGDLSCWPSGPMFSHVPLPKGWKRKDCKKIEWNMEVSTCIRRSDQPHVYGTPCRHSGVQALMRLIGSLRLGQIAAFWNKFAHWPPEQSSLQTIFNEKDPFHFVYMCCNVSCVSWRQTQHLRSMSIGSLLQGAAAWSYDCISCDLGLLENRKNLPFSIGQKESTVNDGENQKGGCHLSLSYGLLAASLNVRQKKCHSLWKIQCNFAVSRETSLTSSLTTDLNVLTCLISFTWSEWIMIMFWFGGSLKWGIPKTICFNTKMVGWFGAIPIVGNLKFSDIFFCSRPMLCHVVCHVDTLCLILLLLFLLHLSCCRAEPVLEWPDKA